MRAATAGRADADFEAFYREVHLATIRALALTLNSRQLGAEASDEAFARAYERWSMVSTYDNPAGWIYRVGLNWSRSWLHRSGREIPLPGMPDGVHNDPIPHPELGPAIAHLPLAQRATVILRFYNDWSIEQIADALSVPAGTVKSRLHRALAALSVSVG